MFIKSVFVYFCALFKFSFDIKWDIYMSYWCDFQVCCLFLFLVYLTIDYLKMVYLLLLIYITDVIFSLFSIPFTIFNHNVCSMHASGFTNRYKPVARNSVCILWIISVFSIIFDRAKDTLNLDIFLLIHFSNSN